MVLGFGSRNRRSSSETISYTVNIHDIRPWAFEPSQHDRRPVLINWRSDDRISGSTKRHSPEPGANNVDGNIPFNESFQIQSFLTRESSQRSSASTESAKFRKKLLQFELYETKVDQFSKGRFLGTAVLDLADLGLLKKSVKIRIPFSLKRSSRGATQPSLYISVSPNEGDVSGNTVSAESLQTNESFHSTSSNSVSTNISLDKDFRDTLSVGTSSDKEGSDPLTNAKLSDRDSEQVEIASFTDDDESPKSSVTVESKVNSTRSKSECSLAVYTVDNDKENDLDSSSLKGKTTLGILDLAVDKVHSFSRSFSSATSTESFPLHSPGSQADLIASLTKEESADANSSVVPKEKPSTFESSPGTENDKSVAFSVRKRDLNECVENNNKEFSNDSCLSPETDTRRGKDPSVDSPISYDFQKLERRELNNEDKDQLSEGSSSVSIIATETEDQKHKKKISDLTRELISGSQESKDLPEAGPFQVIPEILTMEPSEEKTTKVKSKEVLQSSKDEKDKAAITENSYLRGTKASMEKAVGSKQNSKITRDTPKRTNKVSLEVRNNGSYKNNVGMKTILPSQNAKPKNSKGRSKSISEVGMTSPLEFDDKLVEEVKEISISEMQSDDFVSAGMEDSLVSSPVGTGTTMMHSKVGNENIATANTDVSANGAVKEDPSKAEEEGLKEESKRIIFAEARAAVADEKVKHMELEIERLEGELREAALLEAAIYSVVTEHEGSFQKVHSPARRLARFYIYACKNWSPSRRSGAANAAVSGLVLAAKACGNDVPRLTYWWSNTVVLREIICQTFERSQASPQLMRNNVTNGSRRNQRMPSPQRHTENKQGSKSPSLKEGFNDWEETHTFTAALEDIEAWIYGRVIESVWWQTITPYMQCLTEDAIMQPIDSWTKKSDEQTDALNLVDQEVGSFSLDLWKKAFLDAIRRLCPVRAEGHDCGCLSAIPKMVMEHCVARLDVAMLNAILRKHEDDSPSDPISDPISDPNVLPVPACNLSFGSGAKLKNAVGNWSRFLTDLINNNSENLQRGSHGPEHAKESKTKTNFFTLLNEMSDLLMVPKNMLTDKTIKQEVCPNLSSSLIKRILTNFQPDEFCPEPVPPSVMKVLSTEEPKEQQHFALLPAPCVRYHPPAAACIKEKIGDVSGDNLLGRSASGILRKGYISDDELDVVESPLDFVTQTGNEAAYRKSQAYGNGKVQRSKIQPCGNAVANRRHELLREAWG